MRAEGKLYEDSVDCWVVVELLDDLYDLVHTGIFGEGDVFEGDANLACGLGLHAHVDIRVRTYTSLYDRELRLETGVLGLEGLDALCDTVADGPGGRSALSIAQSAYTDFARALPSIILAVAMRAEEEEKERVKERKREGSLADCMLASCAF